MKTEPSFDDPAEWASLVPASEEDWKLCTSSLFDVIVAIGLPAIWFDTPREEINRRLRLYLDEMARKEEGWA